MDVQAFLSETRSEPGYAGQIVYVRQVAPREPEFGELSGPVPPTTGALLMTILAVLIGWRCVRAVIEPAPRYVQSAVRQCILSLVVLDAVVCFVVRDLAGAVAVLTLIVPTVILGRWFPST